MPNVRKNIVLLRNISIVGIPKSTVLINIFRVLMHDQPPMFQNGISENMRSYYIGMIIDGITLSSSDYAMPSNEKKNFPATFEIQMKINCLSLKAEDDALFNNGTNNHTFVMRILKNMLKSEAERLSLQQLEYETYCSDISDDYIKKGILW